MLLRVFPALLIIISLAITGCVKPRPLKKPEAQPGLFSGKSGEFTIYSDKQRKRR